MRRLVVAAAALALWAAPAPAQNLLETQAPVPLGGTDTRSLPNRETLPPMFGANIFTRLPAEGQQRSRTTGPGGVSATPLTAGAAGAAGRGGAGAARTAAGPGAG